MDVLEHNRQKKLSLLLQGAVERPLPLIARRKHPHQKQGLLQSEVRF
jgi:hypothetical protein